MKIAELSPRPMEKEPFRRNSMHFVTEDAGCYALAIFNEDILYVGLAKNLRRRMGQHLDSPEKVNATDHGRAIWFFWLMCDDLNKVERTWMKPLSYRDNAHFLP
jgi:hypothetical protein